MFQKKTFLIFSLMLLTSCSFFQKKEAIPIVPTEEIKLEKKIGIISTPQNQGFLIAETQFLFISESGETIAIESLSVNFKRYLKRRVEIEGKWNTAKTIFTVENITSLGNETRVKTIYRNAVLGLQFSYPSLWILQEEKTNFEGVTITPFETDKEERVDTIVIERLSNARKLSLNEWLGLDENFMPLAPADPHQYQQSSIGTGFWNAVKKISPQGNRVEFFLARDTFFYRFAHTTVNDVDKDIYKNAFFEIAAGFEFIPLGKEEATFSPPRSQGTTTLRVSPPTPTLSELAAQEMASKKQEEDMKNKTVDVETAVKKGMTLIEAKTYKIKIQYPASWYWEYRNGGYNFSNKPVSENNVLLRLTKNPATLPEDMKEIEKIGGRKAMEGLMADVLTLCIQAKARYCLSGDADNKEIIKQMLETVVE